MQARNQLFDRQIFEFVQKFCALQNQRYLLLCLKPHQWVISSTLGKNFGFIFICSEVTAQASWRVSISLWSIELRHLTRRKRCGGFWLPDAKSLLTLYFISDFKSLIYLKVFGCSSFCSVAFVTVMTSPSSIILSLDSILAITDHSSLAIFSETVRKLHKRICYTWLYIIYMYIRLFDFCLLRKRPHNSKTVRISH